MAKGLFIYKPTSDTGVYQSGQWQPSLPLANLKTQQPTEVARSMSAAANTAFIIDAGFSRNWQAFAIINHNFTSAATVQFTSSNDITFATITGSTGQLSAHPGGTGDPDKLWFGFDKEATPGGANYIYLRPAPLVGRYLHFQVLDTSNPDGYVQMGRFMAGMPFIPTFNFTYGASVRIIDPSTVSESVGGQEWWDKRPIRRSISISYDALTKEAALGPLYDMQTKLGLTGNMVFCYDTDEPMATKARRTMYCRFESLDPVVEANPSVSAPFTASLSFVELL